MATFALKAILPFILCALVLYFQRSAFAVNEIIVAHSYSRSLLQPASHAEFSDADFEYALELKKKAKYDSSNYYLEKAGQHFLESGNWASYIKCLNTLGDNHRLLGHFDLAGQYFGRALKHGKQHLGEDHEQVANAYNGLGILKWVKGQYDEVEINWNKALALREKIFGTYHKDVASSHNNLGILYSDRGDFDKALYHHNKALEIRQQILDSTHVDLASSYTNLGVVYRRKFENDTALAYYVKALAIRIKHHGEEHPMVGSLYKSFGLGYFTTYAESCVMMNMTIALSP